MKNVGAVFMDKDSMRVSIIISIPTRMLSRVDNQDSLIQLGSEPLRQGCACESGSDDKPVNLHRLQRRGLSRQATAYSLSNTQRMKT